MRRRLLCLRLCFSCLLLQPSTEAALAAEHAVQRSFCLQQPLDKWGVFFAKDGRGCE